MALPDLGLIDPATPTVVSGLGTPLHGVPHMFRVSAICAAGLLSALIYGPPVVAGQRAMPGDVVAVIEEKDATRLTAWSPRLQARSVAHSSESLNLNGLAIVPGANEVFGISKNVEGTLYRMDGSLAVNFDGPTRTWAGCGFVQVEVAGDSLFFLSGLENGWLAYATRGLTKLTWGPKQFGAHQIAASPDGEHVYVASNQNGGTL